MLHPVTIRYEMGGGQSEHAELNNYIAVHVWKHH